MAVRSHAHMKDYFSPPLLDKDNFLGEWQVFNKSTKTRNKIAYGNKISLKCQPCQQLWFTWSLLELTLGSFQKHS